VEESGRPRSFCTSENWMAQPRTSFAAVTTGQWMRRRNSGWAAWKYRIIGIGGYYWSLLFVSEGRMDEIVPAPGHLLSVSETRPDRAGSGSWTGAGSTSRQRRHAERNSRRGLRRGTEASPPYPGSPDPRRQRTRSSTEINGGISRAGRDAEDLRRDRG